MSITQSVAEAIKRLLQNPAERQRMFLLRFCMVEAAFAWNSDYRVIES